MTFVNTDIDIDFADRDAALIGLDYIDAMIINKKDQITKHQSGVYFQNIPVNPITGFAAFDYKSAEDNGYFKLDFLNQTVYKQIKNEDHLDKLMTKEPPWELLTVRELVDQLIHIKDHFEIVQIINPQSIEDLAVVLALIRPGKRYLLRKSRAEIDANVWKLDGNDGYVFRKAHAISYAVLIVVQINLIIEQLVE